MSDSSLAGRIYRACRLTGQFTLRSRKQATEYFDKYRSESDPHLLGEICEGLARMVPADTEILAGLELGGIPLATRLSAMLELPAVFVRKRAKDYGTKRLCEGSDVSGRKVLVIEDVVTSGGQLIQASQDLRLLGAVVSDALCAIDREEGGSEAASAVNLRLRSLFRREDFHHFS